MTFLNPSDAPQGQRLPPAAEITADADRAALHARLDALAQLLDSAIRIPGTSVRIGADAALNIIPGVGTLVAKGLSSYIIFEARRMGVPKTTLLRMIANLGIDFVISAIPFAGWVGDAFYRSNLRNIALLKAHLERQP